MDIGSHLNTLMARDLPRTFGVEFVRRTCEIPKHSTAKKVVELGVEMGILEQTSRPYLYRVKR